MLSVVNRLKQSVSIRINERPAGTVAAGERGELSVQERGKITVYADLEDGKRSWHRQFTVQDARILHWVISE